MIELDILEEIEVSPKRTTSLLSRHAPLMDTHVQLDTLDALQLNTPDFAGDFYQDISAHGWADFKPANLEIFQINIGKLCNMTCRHCHVDSGPDRTEENMDLATVEACLAAIRISGAHSVDITGGAPELNPHFEYLVEECVKMGKHVMDRCNLTILTLPRFKHLPQWFADHGVEIVCSLPHYRKLNTDTQRGDGTYEKSIKALKLLNEVGYGQGDSKRKLTLVTNPVGAFLSSNQSSMEREWKTALANNYEVHFDRLIAINNMPISRYLEWLLDTNNLQGYMERLVNAFNPATIGNVMCRNTISVSWDGRLFDCDFNQMLDLEAELPDKSRPTIHEFDLAQLQARQIRTARHCYGCTAGAGSSCGGALE
jgi:radical SAM/Cys-rich protein